MVCSLPEMNPRRAIERHQDAVPELTHDSVSAKKLTIAPEGDGDLEEADVVGG